MCTGRSFVREASERLVSDCAVDGAPSTARRRSRRRRGVGAGAAGVSVRIESTYVRDGKEGGTEGRKEARVLTMEAFELRAFKKVFERDRRRSRAHGGI